MHIGVISDTHGLLRPQVFSVFQGVDHILHAGDVGPPDILTELEALAPLTAVYGNTDDFDLRARIPEVARLELAGVPTVLLHGHQLAPLTPEAAASAHPDGTLVIYGHTHRPRIENVGETLTLNPGSAGPRRFKLPVSVALIEIREGRIRPRLVELDT